MAERRGKEGGGGEQLKKKKILPIARRTLASFRPCPASHVITSESRSRDGMTYFSFTLDPLSFSFSSFLSFPLFFFFLFYISRSREKKRDARLR